MNVVNRVGSCPPLWCRTPCRDLLRDAASTSWKVTVIGCGVDDKREGAPEVVRRGRAGFLLSRRLFEGPSRGVILQAREPASSALPLRSTISSAGSLRQPRRHEADTGRSTALQPRRRQSGLRCDRDEVVAGLVVLDRSCLLVSFAFRAGHRPIGVGNLVVSVLVATIRSALRQRVPFHLESQGLDQGATTRNSGAGHSQHQCCQQRRSDQPSCAILQTPPEKSLQTRYSQLSRG